MITQVDSTNLSAASRIHSESWRSSHRSFCSEDFIERHTPERQLEYLRTKMAGGTRVFMLTDGEPAGIVSVTGDLIEDLYVLPGKQNRGYGTRLLMYAAEKCAGTPRLRILENNTGAERLYRRLGFRESGIRESVIPGGIGETEFTFCGRRAGFITDEAVFDGHNRMEYISFGNGERILVILPGLSLQSVIPAAPAVARQYGMFRREFTVYLFDRRSDLPDPYTISDMAGDTVKAVTALGLGKLCLFGASQGGMIAQVMAVRHPELVERLALGSSACRTWPERSEVINEWIRLAEEGKARELCLSFGEKVYPKEIFEKYRDAFAKMSESVTEAELRRFAILAKGAGDFDIREEIRNVRCPVFAAGSRDDAVLGGDSTPEIARILGDNPLFEMHMYDSCGHAAYDTAPDFPDRLYGFFTKDIPEYI